MRPPQPKFEMDLPLANPNEHESKTHLRVEVYYSLGGINYGTYKSDPRGVYVSVGPIGKRPSTTPGLTVESFMVFSGVKHLMRELKRKSDKVSQEVWAEVQKQVEEKAGITWEVIQHVCQKNEIALADEKPG